MREKTTEREISNARRTVKFFFYKINIINKNCNICQKIINHQLKQIQ